MEVLAFGVVVLAWLAFLGTAVFSQPTIHEVWAWFKDQSLLLQLPLAIVLLPWLDLGNVMADGGAGCSRRRRRVGQPLHLLSLETARLRRAE